MQTKKDFVLIAKLLKWIFEGDKITISEDDKKFIVSAFGNELKTQNSRFDRVKFENAVFLK